MCVRTRVGRKEFGATLSIQFLDPGVQAALHQTNLPVIGRSLAQTDVDTCLDAIARQADQAAAAFGRILAGPSPRVRFVRGGDSALSGTYTARRDATS